jgi:hypothetical protein
MQDFPVEARPISPVGDHLTPDGATGGPGGEHCYASSFLAGKFACFDPPVALSGDLDDQRGVFEAIPDGLRDYPIADDLGPVVQGE